MKRNAAYAVCLTLLLSAAQPASAYDDEVHYALTYYVARCVGYTYTQATRIANACVGVDYAYDTEPVQMHGVRFGARLLVKSPIHYLLPETADADSKNFQPKSDLDLADPEKTSNDLESPASLYNQGPRLKFHGFIREPGGESGKPWYLMGNEEREAFQNDEAMNLRGQAALLWNDAIKHRNPGVFLHFFQDLVPHAGYGSKYGHYDVFINKHQRMAADMPQGPITDWMSYRAQPTDAERCLHDHERDRLYVNKELFEATANRLSSYMKSASERQVPLKATADEDLLMKLVLANCPPKGNLTGVGDLLDYKSDDSRFRPNLENTRIALSERMKLDGMEEGTIPEPALPLPYNIQADRKYYFGWLRNQEADFYEPDPSKGWQEQPGAESDAWVLWGDLTVQLVFPDDYEPNHRFEVVALLPSTQDREREYELKSLNQPWESRYLKDDPAVVIRGLPVGEVIIELRRADGEKLRHPRRVPITKREDNIVEVSVTWGDSLTFAFLPDDPLLIHPGFDVRGRWYNFSTSRFEVETDREKMTGPIGNIKLWVSKYLFEETEADELRHFVSFVNENRPRDSMPSYMHDRHDVSPREVIFTQRKLSGPQLSTTYIVGFYSLPGHGYYFCSVTGADHIGHDQLIAEWNRIKLKVNDLFHVRAQGVSR